MEELFPVLIFASFVVGFVTLALNSAKKHQKLYRDTAAVLGLNCFASGKYGTPRLMGLYRGFEVLVDKEVHGSGKHKITYTRFRAQPLKPLPGGMSVCKEGLGGKIGKFFGGQDILVGDKRLDDALLIKGERELEIQQWFQQVGVGQAVIRFLDLGSRARLSASEGGVILVKQRMESMDLIQHYLDELVDHLIPIGRDAGNKQDSPVQFPEQSAPKPEQAPVALPVPTPAKKRWDLSDMQAEAKSTPAPAPVLPAAPQSSEPVAVPKPTVAAPAVAVDPRLVRLSSKDLGYRERSELIESLKNQTIEVRLTVKESERSRGLGLEEPYRHGQTVIGSVGPCELGVHCPLGETDAIKALRAGEVQVWKVRVLDWDNFYRRASCEKVI